MTDSNSGYVSWGRYDAEHQEIVKRLDKVEQAASRRRDRLWQLAMVVLGGIAVTVLSTSLIAWLHIRGAG